MVSGLDRLQRRHPKVALPIAVVYEYVDDSGGYLAAMITYYAFVSLFPLLLLLTTVLGLVLAGHAGLQHRIEAPALSQFPVIGDDLGRRVASVGARSAWSSESSAPSTAGSAWPRQLSTP